MNSFFSAYKGKIGGCAKTMCSHNFLELRETAATDRKKKWMSEL